jgi:regulator of sigma E protease
MAGLMVLAAFGLGSIPSMLYVALGLGLVIFFHELGHFAVAKWCNVYVERFSIGFGPILFSRKYGETEYALSAIPFGGYVKMLGQDDMDPSQLSSEDMAKNPRSYSAKSVPQRMAIISAGVIMNILTAIIFFGVAFGIGVQQLSPAVGNLQPGLPAWNAGLKVGDRISGINGRRVDTFTDILRGVALSTGSIDMEVTRGDEKFSLQITPDKSGNATRRRIGVAPTNSLQLMKFADAAMRPVVPNSAAARAKPAFEPHDTITKVNGKPVASYLEFEDFLARHPDEKVALEVEREVESSKEKKTLEVTVEPNRVRTLGLWLDVGKIVAVQANSPAAEAKLQVDDKIIRINNESLGKDINTLRLPDVLSDLHGQAVKITVARQVKGGELKEVDLEITPRLAPGWTEPPMSTDSPLSVPAIGVAFHIVPIVLKVEPGSPADGKIQVGERIRSLEFIRAEASDPDRYANPLVVADELKDVKQEGFYTTAFWRLQELPNRTVKLVVVNRDGKDPREVIIEPTAEGFGDWNSPDRGFVFDEDWITLKADGPAEAVNLGMTHTRNSVTDIYLTLRNVFTGDVSLKELHGPVMIAKVAYAAASQGVADLSLFLGLLSVNLAVINFLPIPVLDGGHMVFLLWEAVTRRKPSERVLVTAQYFGMAFVLGLMALVLFLDLFVHSAKGN